jgi:hypothetical protein
MLDHSHLADYFSQPPLVRCVDVLVDARNDFEGVVGPLFLYGFQALFYLRELVLCEDASLCVGSSKGNATSNVLGV